jgi:hypothetical protein
MVAPATSIDGKGFIANANLAAHAAVLIEMPE